MRLDHGGVVLSTMVMAATLLLAVPQAAQARRSTLSEKGKALLWSQACNLPTKRYAKKDIAAAKVVLTDAAGRKFAPQPCRWCNVPGYVHGLLSTALMKVAHVEGKAPKDKKWRKVYDWFKIVGGFAPGKKRNKATPFKTSKAAVRWAIALVPPAQTPLCGATAQVLYDSSVRPTARATAEALLFTLEEFKRVKLKQLAKAYASNDENHDYLRRCIHFGTADGRRNYAKVGNCFWWLRRAAAGDRMVVAKFVAHVMKTYDAPWWKDNKARFPKKLRR